MVLDKVGGLNQPAKNSDLVLRFWAIKDEEIINSHSFFTKSTYSIRLGYRRNACISMGHLKMSERALWYLS